MLSRFFIDRPIFAAVVSILFIIGGLVAMKDLPIEQYPQITPPTVVVTASYPGASATTIANLVAEPIEQQVNGVEGMLYMSSASSGSGKYQLTITFELGTDIDMATVLVENRVNIALSSLPEEVQRLGVTTSKESTNIVLFLALVSDSPEYDALYLSNYANLNVINNLERLPGVGGVDLFGAGNYSMRIWLDPDKLAVRNLTPEDVIAAIQSQNTQVAAGNVGSSPMDNYVAYQYTLQMQGLLTDAEEFGNIILRSLPDGSYLRVRDVAEVVIGRYSYSSDALYDNKSVAALSVYQLPGANALSVSDRVSEEMEKLSAYFPTGVHFEIPFDATEFVDSSIVGIYETLITAFVLVLVVIMLFLQNWRAMLIPMATIPVSLVGTFLFMSMMDFSINTLTLFGLVLAIGLVVDDAIIIVENSSRLIETNQYATVREAVIQAMKEVSGAVVGIVIVLMAVFIPTAFIGGITGELYRQFALTLAASTLISGFNALTLSPALCVLFLKKEEPKKTGFFAAFNRFFEKVTQKFVMATEWLIKHLRWTFIAFLVLSFIGLWFFIRLPRTFLPEEDQGYFIVFTQLNDGASQAQTADVLQRITQILDKTEGVEHFITINGFSMMTGSNASNTATVFVILDNWSERKSKALAASSIVRQFNAQAYVQIPEAETFAVQPPAITGLGQSSGFEVMLQDINSYGDMELQEVAYELMFAAAETPGLSSVNTFYSADVPQYFLNIDRDRAEMMQIPMSNVFNTISSFLGSDYVNNFVKFGRTYQVMIEGMADSRASITDLRRLHVRNSNGEMVPLTAFTTVEKITGVSSLTRYNTYAAALLQGSAADGYSSGEAIDIMAKLIQEKAGTAFGYEWTSMAFQEINASSSTSLIFILAIVTVYLILAAQYESLTDPIAVIMGLPIAILGVVVGVVIMGLPISVYTQIGVVLLLGLAAKNAILIVEFARDYQKEGEDVAMAAMEGGRVRLRPIIMTSFAFILGTFPLVVASGAGAAGQISLGIAVFAGMLLCSTLGTLFIPGFFVMTRKLNRKPKNK